MYSLSLIAMNCKLADLGQYLRQSSIISLLFPVTPNTHVFDQRLSWYPRWKGSGGHDCLAWSSKSPSSDCSRHSFRPVWYRRTLQVARHGSWSRGSWNRRGNWRLCQNSQGVSDMGAIQLQPCFRADVSYLKPVEIGLAGDTVKVAASIASLVIKVKSSTANNDSSMALTNLIRAHSRLMRLGTSISSSASRKASPPPKQLP